MRDVSASRFSQERPPLLDVEGLRVAYGKANVLHGVTFRVGAGEFVSVLGRNGAGKSTTVHALSGLIPKRAGSVRFDGTDVTGWTPRALVRAGLVQVLQGHRIFPSLTVEDNILIGAAAAGRRPTRAELAEIYEIFGEIADRRRQPASGLSGGQQQILAVAQGMIACPRLLILDEPSLGLAPVVVDRILGVGAQLRSKGVSILLIEQLVDKALAHSDRCYLMETGRMVYEATPERLVGNDVLHRAFLGGHVA